MPDYEALVKVEDNVNPNISEDKKGGLYRRGDIVVVRPKGWKWGKMERKHFAIVTIPNLTEEQAKSLEYEEFVFYHVRPLPDDPKIAEVTNAGRRIVTRRKYSIDLDELFTHDSETPNEELDRKYKDREVEYQPLKDSDAKHHIKKRAYDSKSNDLRKKVCSNLQASKKFHKFEKKFNVQDQKELHETEKVIEADIESEQIKVFGESRLKAE